MLKWAGLRAGHKVDWGLKYWKCLHLFKLLGQAIMTSYVLHTSQWRCYGLCKLMCLNHTRLLKNKHSFCYPPSRLGDRAGLVPMAHVTI